MAAKQGRRGFKFTVQELESMLEAIDDIVPIGNPNWERVWDRHNTRYPQKNRTAESIRRKFQTLVKKKMKTGDPNCPPHIRSAKRIYRKIVEATDGSDGESNKEREDDDDEDDKEDNSDDEDADVGGDDDEEDDDDNDGGGGGGGVGKYDYIDEMMRERDGDRPLLDISDITAASTEGSCSGKNRSSESKGGGGGAAKKGKGFAKPLRIPRKSKSKSDSDDADDDGFSFGRMMTMMMMQHRQDNEQRERQYRSEYEQREREYDLRREEMAIAREDARAQRQMMQAQSQMMNAMFMSMLNKNGGDNSNPPPSPSKT